jgi:hypothetical protein
MTKQSLVIALGLYAVTLSLQVVSYLGLPVKAQAISEDTNQTSRNHTSATVVFRPPGTGAPRDTVGGASRDGGVCPQDSAAQHSDFVSLLPQTNFGLTVSERPTFSAYMPQTGAQAVFFSLKEEHSQDAYQATFPLPKSPGIVSFRLPDDAPALEVGRSYKWSMVIICRQSLRPDDPRIEGWVQRVEPDQALANQLETATPLQQAALYGTSGIWFDTVNTLIELRYLQPHDSTLVETWEELLNSVELDAIAAAPLIRER